MDIESLLRSLEDNKNTTVFFASLDDLIRMKKAVARAKDKEDLRILLRLKKKQTARSE